MESLVQDLRRALRTAVQQPLFSAVVILTLAIGIGANAAVFSVVNGVLLRPLPFPEPDRVVGTWFVSPVFVGLNRVRHSQLTYTHFRGENRMLDALGLAEPTSATVSDGTNPRRVRAAMVTASLFDVLGAPTQVGRAITPEDDVVGAAPVAVISDVFWRRDFGADPSLMGRSVEIDGVSTEIIGVLPPSLRFPDADTDVWLPLRIDPARLDGNFFYTGYGRMRAGVTPEDVRRDMLRAADLLPDAYPRQFPRVQLERLQLDFQVLPVHADLVGDVRSVLWILLAAAGLVLAIVGANLTNLFLVRAQRRRTELAVRRALGAGGRRIAQYLITEGAVYAVLGGLAGLVLAQVAINGITAARPDSLPRVEDIRIDGVVLLFTAIISIGTGVISGTFPAIQSWRTSFRVALTSGARSSGPGAGGTRLLNGFLVGQFALSFMLLVGSGLLLRTFASVRDLDPGFQPDNTLTLRLALPETDYPTWDAAANQYYAIMDAIADLPGVAAVGAGDHLPLRDHRVFSTYVIEDFPAEEGDIPRPILTKVVSEGYFETLGIPVLAGRTFRRSDREADANVTIVSDAFSRLYWEDEYPIGKRIRRGAEWTTIVGVVGSNRDRSLTDPPAEMVYSPMTAEIGNSGHDWREMTVAARTPTPLALVERVRALVASRDPNLPLFDVRSMDQVMSDAVAQTRFTMQLLLASALSAVVLATIGLYGVLAYTVRIRRREIGVRVALGAQPHTVRNLVVRRGVTMAGFGVVAGIAAGVGGTRFLAAVLHGVQPVDPATFVGVGLLLVAVAWVASGIAAAGAIRIDPVVVLQAE